MSRGEHCQLGVAIYDAFEFEQLGVSPRTHECAMFLCMVAR
jgi:hypothetical protein